MTSDIQRARDVLDKWRATNARSSHQWHIERHNAFGRVRDGQQNMISDVALIDDAELIVGTAGNPDLLDAIDNIMQEGLDVAGWSNRDPIRLPILSRARRLAAAIIAADERMNS